MRTVLLLVLATLPSLAGADILHMADGTTREGRVVETNDKEIVVDFGQGSVSLVVRLPRAQVARIEPKETANLTLMTDYAARVAQAMDGTADDWHALGLWCRQQRCLNDKATQAFERAVALDPAHAGAHLALGHVRLNDAWMTRKQALQLLAPEIDEAARVRELDAQKQLEEAETRALEAQKRNTELEAKLADLQKEVDDLRLRLAAATPPPAPPRVIYRPIIVVPPPRPPVAPFVPAPRAPSSQSGAGTGTPPKTDSSKDKDKEEK